MSLDLRALGNLSIVYGVNLFGALVVGVVGWWLAGVVQRLFHRLLSSTPRMDPTVASFLSSLARYAVLVVTFLIILQLIGVQATSLIAVLGAASLAIGLALQGTLSNMAAGVMLLIFRPFKMGDSIEVAGKSGTVQDLNLFMTELASGDNVQVLIPNSQVWGTALTNYSSYGTRRIAIDLALPWEVDIESLTSRARSLLAHDPRTLDEPHPSVTLSSLGDKTVGLSIQAWARADAAGGVKADLLKEIHRLVRGAEAEPAHSV
jgi:small conductance mechanosensitive channel